MTMGECTIEHGLDDLDLLELMELGDEWGVDLQGIKTMESCRERLELHKRKEENEQFFTFDPERFMSINQEYDDKTKAVIELFKKVRTSLGSSLKPVASILKAGNISADLSEDFDQHIKDLESRECCLVFAGETSSGKSSLLNLVLGMDVLPTHAVSSTFIICKLKYSKTFGSKLVYRDGSTEEFQYETSEQAKQSLDKKIFDKNLANREKESKIKVIEIYLPAIILQSGITIVDTPGFGENSMLNDQVVRFISSTSITGFIYLIRTDTAGGVEEDRLLDFLREIQKLRTRNSITKMVDTMNNKGSMFICNRWDIVRDDEKENVKANAISKLTDAWPGLQESQIEFFSTEDASKHAIIDRDYITRDFAGLLNKLVTIIQASLDTRIKQHYRWLKTILHQTTGHVISMVSQMNKSNEELDQKFNEATGKIKQLNENANETVHYLNHCIETESQNLIRNIKEYLKSREIKKAIRQWSITMDFQSKSNSSETFTRSSPNIYETIALRKLVDQIDIWIKDNKYDERMISTLETKINSKFEVLKGEMEDINNEMTDGRSLSSNSSGSTLPDDELAEMLTCVKKARRKKLKSKIEDIAHSTPGSQVILMPKVLIARAILSTMNLARGGRRTSAYTSDPKEFIKDKAVMILDVLLKDENLLQKLCARYTETLKEYVENIKQSIPTFIAANQTLMEEISSSRQMTCENKDALTQTIKKLDSVRELTRGYECLYVRDLRTESLSLPKTDTIEKLTTSSRQSLAKSLSNSNNSHFVNCVSFCGQLGTVTLSNKDEHTCIMSRTSNFNLDEDTVFKETARLRHLQNTYIAPFLGTFRRDRKAVYIFAGNLRPISRYLTLPHLADIKGLTIKIINGLVSGLAALHKLDLVHMELTPQTVMIDADDEEVKLFGGCLPQKIPSLQDNDSEKVGFIQYLSPDVLNGKQYSKADDIYSLALVIWKLISTNSPFQDQNALTRAAFIKQLNPEKMLKIRNTWPTPLQNLFRKCLFSNAEDRLTIDTVAEILSRLELKDIVSEMSQVRRRQVYNRLSRSKPRSSHNSSFEDEH